MTTTHTITRASKFVPLTKEQVHFEVSISPEECVPVRGNALASGDEELDREVEAEIIGRLDRGDYSAWCTVWCKAYIGGDSATVGRASLGCCTLTDDYTAEQCAAEYDLQADALDRLNEELRIVFDAYQAARAKRARKGGK